MKRISYKLLTDQSANTKMAKNGKSGEYLTAILHLAPHTLAGPNVCPFASKGCIAACLNTAGRGGIIKKGETTNSIQRARIRRTLWFKNSKVGFFDALYDDLSKLSSEAYKRGLRPAVRLNGTSDIPWEKIKVPNTGYSIIEHFSGIQFYDYTKWPYDKRPNESLPSNYYLTMSSAEDNFDACQEAQRHGRNVIVVVDLKKHQPMPIQYTDGDKDDLRFLDEPGKLVAVRAKGKAIGDTSGFVIHLEENSHE